MKYTTDNIAFDCHYCIVWYTKYRREVLTEKIADRLKELIRLICKERNFTLHSLQVSASQVRISLEIDPRWSAHSVVKLFKSRSSHVLRAEFPKLKSRLPTLWTNSYFAATEEPEAKNLEKNIAQHAAMQPRSERRRS